MRAEFRRPAVLKGSVRVPGDKSISHRALILAAMCRGRSDIRGCGTGADVEATRFCLARLGVAISGTPEHVSVVAQGWAPLQDIDLDCMNSGSTMRLLTGALAGAKGIFRLRGDESLSRRPMDRIAVPLNRMGAEVTLHDDRFPPIELRGAPLTGISYKTPVASAQVKGAVLLAGLMAEGTTVLTEPRPTRDHTERMLHWLGADVVIGDDSVSVSGDLGAEGFEIEVPGDVSSAAYWLAAAVCSPGSEIEIRSVGVNPSRIHFLQVMKEMGADIDLVEVGKDPEPSGNLIVRGSAGLEPIELGPDRVPLLIDEIPALVLLATQANGTTTITGAEELRVKESDRIGNLVEPLRRMGAEIQELPDGMIIHGPTPLLGGTVDPKGDHRIALTMAVAGLISNDAVTISDWDCVGVSYPTFIDDLHRISG